MNKKNIKFKTYIRARPIMVKEAYNGKYITTINPYDNKKDIEICDYTNLDIVKSSNSDEEINKNLKFRSYKFGFDRIFDEDSNQNEIFNEVGKETIDSLFQGYNSAIIAYGQTGTGKTYTMEGNLESLGIIPNCVQEIFNKIKRSSNVNDKYILKCSYLQIYNEVISDLLKNERNNLQIRETKEKGIYVENLSEWAIRGSTDVLHLLNKGLSTRKNASTFYNDYSSRSHAIFTIILEKTSTNMCLRSKLTLVDLAGSERLKNHDKTGERLLECKNINKSLSTLGKVFNCLLEDKRIHIPFRDSKLTRILEDCLGGNCWTKLIGTISPSPYSFSESYSTLEFIKRAGNIKKEININKIQSNLGNIKKYEVEIMKLKTELDKKSKLITELHKKMDSGDNYETQNSNLNPNEKELYLNEIENKNRLYLRERDERKILEKRIDNLNSQLLNADSHKLENNQLNISGMSSFTKNKDPMKMEQIILKQRDIINILTLKLNEKEMNIKQLTEEFSAFEKINQDIEMGLNYYKNKSNYFEKILKENNIKLKENIKFDHNNSDTNIIKIQDKVEIQDIETFNITKQNLSLAEEKIKNLEKITKKKDNEIQDLKNYLENKINNSDTANMKKVLNFCRNEVEGIILALNNEIKQNKEKIVAEKIIKLYNFLNK